MSDQFLGEIRPAAFNFAPYGWALCQGQILAISQYSALFSLLGVRFGGNGSTNFALPNLQSSIVMGPGTGAGLSPYVIGETGGNTQVTLMQSQMPIHSHAPAANSGGGGNTTPADSIWALETDGAGSPCAAYLPPPANILLSPAMVLPAGNSQPLSIMQPTLTINYMIALTGNFPQRP